MGKQEHNKQIDEYIAGYAGEAAKRMQIIRDIVHQLAPNAEERFSWQMPTFWQGENLVHFAAHKQHIGLYPGAEAMEHFASRLDKEGYKYSKGAMQLPFAKSLDETLVRDVVAYRVKMVEG